LLDDLRRLLAGLPGNLLGVRDRVLLLIGFCGAFRRSDLVALDAAAVAVTREGLVITIRRSKTDQESSGRQSICVNGDSVLRSSRSITT
jgi:site-specific recombinase XerC